MPVQRLRVERHVHRIEAQVRERLSHDRLPRSLVAQQRRRLHQTDEQILHRRPLGGDRLHDLFLRHCGGTSRAGLRSKNPNGLSQKDTVSTAITGHSSGLVT